MDGSQVTVWMPSSRPHLAHCPTKNTFSDLCECHLPVIHSFSAITTAYEDSAICCFPECRHQTIAYCHHTPVGVFQWGRVSVWGNPPAQRVPEPFETLTPTTPFSYNSPNIRVLMPQGLCTCYSLLSAQKKLLFIPQLTV